jgi:hypothetical protein
MKKALLLCIAILCISSLVFAQAGTLGVFADPGGTVCDLTDAAPGLVLVYIVHMFSPGGTAAQFGIEETHPMTYLSESPGTYIKIGTCAGPSGFGCAIAYGGCYPTPNMILTIQYFGSGLSPACSYIKVVEDGTAVPPILAVTDCADPPNLLDATGGIGYFNNDGNCPCDVPVEETSWGQIKSLYK